MLSIDEKYWLSEALKTTRNLCDVSLMVLEQGKDDLLPTVLELLHLETQEIVEDYCILGEEG